MTYLDAARLFILWIVQPLRINAQNQGNDHWLCHFVKVVQFGYLRTVVDDFCCRLTARTKCSKIEVFQAAVRELIFVLEIVEDTKSTEEKMEVPLVEKLDLPFS